MIQACAGLEVIPQGPPEGDHMANGRVEMAVREEKKTIQNPPKGVPIAGGSPLLSWLSRFEVQVMNKMRSSRD